MTNDRSRRRRSGAWARIAVLLVLIPGLVGGCPEYRDQLVTVAENATRSWVLSGEPGVDVVETVARGVVDATITFTFDLLRSDSNRF